MIIIVYTEVNKIALSSNDDKRLQTFDGITTYPIGTNAFKVCENEMTYAILKKIILKLLTLVKEKPRNKCIIKKKSLHLKMNHRHLEMNRRKQLKMNRTKQMNHGKYLIMNHMYLEKISIKK